MVVLDEWGYFIRCFIKNKIKIKSIIKIIQIPNDIPMIKYSILKILTEVVVDDDNEMICWGFVVIFRHKYCSSVCKHKE